MSGDDKRKPTETWAAFFAVVVSAVAACLSVYATWSAGKSADAVNKDNKNYDVVQNLAPFIISNDARQNRYGLSFLKAYWSLNKATFPPELVGVVIYSTAVTQTQRTEVLKLVCTMRPALEIVATTAEDAELRAMTRGVIADADTSSICAPTDDTGPATDVVQEAKAAPAVAPSVAPGLSVSNGTGFSVYVSSDRTEAEAFQSRAAIERQLSAKHQTIPLYVMHPARLPCWWGLTVGFDLTEPDARTLRDQARKLGFGDAYITRSIPRDAAKAACPSAWQD